MHNLEYSIICIGLSELSVDLGRLPGLELGSIAYHEDKGYAFDSYLSRYLYVSKFGTGDVVGCGVAEGGALGYYTKNGRHLGELFLSVP